MRFIGYPRRMATGRMWRRPCYRPPTHPPDLVLRYKSGRRGCCPAICSSLFMSSISCSVNGGLWMTPPPRYIQVSSYLPPCSASRPEFVGLELLARSMLWRRRRRRPAGHRRRPDPARQWDRIRCSSPPMATSSIISASISSMNSSASACTAGSDFHGTRRRPRNLPQGPLAPCLRSDAA